MPSGDHRAPVRMEFHISRDARDRYQFDQSLFSLSGNVILANFRATREFAQKMNDKRDLVAFPEQAVRAGHVNAMGLIDEISHYVVGLYREQRNPDAMRKALGWLQASLGADAVNTALRAFTEQFPPVDVYQRAASIDDYLNGDTAGVPNREIALEEMLMLWLANLNPAFSPFLELFDDALLEKETAYSQVMAGLHTFFDTQPPFGPDHQNLIDMLRAPALVAPHSLSAQLQFIRERWGYLVGRLLYRLLGGLDMIREEERPFFRGPGPARVLEFRGLEAELERFSEDKDWMPRLVLLAKTTYVWLDQLSKKYQRNIYRLDQIPDEELELLARRGFSGLWLIGLWERSRASKSIKEMMGNPEAIASAYSLFEYRVAEDLGGEEAFQVLRDRAWRYGIRMASDMVPNHMGIDSKWVIEHPDWFIELDYSPYPSYSFNGPDLSWDERVGIFLEDHYYNHSDAAVVFKRLDRWTGTQKYIYHGNDGTSFPWNDTAQLNYLMPEVREAVIQTILAIARRFPIIRFDAAMTLAKRHFQRLWFPEPGEGGGIPSRSEFGLTKAQFDAAMPEEFWREVVDRVAAEVPDTLLLAEAFWLMEGYFVRTLGMHRVYNSAFMNMLRDEENSKYRSVIKNTLEFDPEIMKRYVNFMNNPDERTAVDQFGKDDKYFGVCTMMATLPGLPMFGHGQIEGFAEKYGMEFRRANWNELPDNYLIERHDRQIFPLLHKRYLFSGVDNFLLYDFFTPEGYVNEDVFAYSNRVGDERGLVVYHNRFGDTRGWIRRSAAYLQKDGDRRLVQKDLHEGLGLHTGGNYYSIFRDQASGLEFIRSNRELSERGLYVELGAYKLHVLLDFRQVMDDEMGHYAELAAYLNGAGVPSIDEALRELFLQPVRLPYAEIVNAAMFHRLLAARSSVPGSPATTAERAQESFPPATPTEAGLLDQVEQKMDRLLGEIKRVTGDPASLAREVRQELETVLLLPGAEVSAGAAHSPGYQAAISYLRDNLTDDPALWGTLLAWVFTHNLGKVADAQDYEQQSLAWIDEWLLGKIIVEALREFGLDEGAAHYAVATVKLITAHNCWRRLKTPGKQRAYRVLESWLKDQDVQRYLAVNRYQDVLWFNQESLDRFLWWMSLASALDITPDPLHPTEDAAGQIAACYEVAQQIHRASEKSGYQVEALLAAVKS